MTPLFQQSLVLVKHGHCGNADSTFVPPLSQGGGLALLAFLPETKDAARLKLPPPHFPAQSNF